ncbi:unnamed protein product [Didymodactylos carnosus]|uniref:C2H2-type domain-containing protein n=1 Tax=Didymodactylos carnosus TaxID=1234261 RepID=A0A813ZIK2_9BILA|nr:unnamed protein product [Didymodactylos carnosus]CAF0899236.1 unnamed protein product [Didymodactylos carnosus]CAF3588873.1 unnamed protein product [Didymodactylos carnosus]CAF3681973.1 unnamed protein product [Didymodactylos carnosus]
MRPDLCNENNDELSEGQGDADEELEDYGTVEQGYEALLDGCESVDDNGHTDLSDYNRNGDIDDNDEEEVDQKEEIVKEEIDDGLPKAFCCKICSASYSKFELYCDHFISVSHRYKRRDAKKQQQDGLIETEPVETFVNICIFNKLPLESVQFIVDEVDSLSNSYSGSLLYNDLKFSTKENVSSLNSLYQELCRLFNESREIKLRLPPQSFYVARDVSRKDDSIWTVSRYCDDTGKSDEQVVKEVLDYCVFSQVETERERMLAHSIKTWRMFHRNEKRPGFWCDICKQCFRKRKGILSHFETSDKHETNSKFLPRFRRAIQHSLVTGRLLNEILDAKTLEYHQQLIQSYRLPPNHCQLKNAYYCTFCNRSFPDLCSLEKHIIWKGHRQCLRARRYRDVDNLLRLASYLNFTQLSKEQKRVGMKKMIKAPDDYRKAYNLEPITVDIIREDVIKFDMNLAQTLRQQNNNKNQQHPQHQNGYTNQYQGNRQTNYRGRGRQQQQQQQQRRGVWNNYHQNRNFSSTNNTMSHNGFKRQNDNNNGQSWKKPRYDNNTFSSFNHGSFPQQQPPQQQRNCFPQTQTPLSARVDYRYIANKNIQQEYHSTGNISQQLKPSF